MNQSAVTNTARGWIGTPFHLHGRVKHAGVDCIGLIIGVAKELQLATKQHKLLHALDHTNYSLKTRSDSLLMLLDEHLERVAEPHDGAIALLTYDSNPQHIGFIGKRGDEFTLIHSSITIRKVVEHTLDKESINRIIAIFKPGEITWHQ